MSDVYVLMPGARTPIQTNDPDWWLNRGARIVDTPPPVKPLRNHIVPMRGRRDVVCRDCNHTAWEHTPGMCDHREPGGNLCLCRTTVYQIEFKGRGKYGNDSNR